MQSASLRAEQIVVTSCNNDGGFSKSASVQFRQSHAVTFADIVLEV